MKEARLTLRLDADVRQALEAAALKDGRTLSSLTQRILRDWLAAQKRAR